MRLNRHFVKIYANTSAFAESIHAHTPPRRSPSVPPVRGDRPRPADGSPVAGCRSPAVGRGRRRVTSRSVAGGPPRGTDESGLPLEPSADQLDDAPATRTRMRARALPQDGLERLLAGARARVAGDSLLPSHGGFRGSQLLESDGELGVIDFDGFCRSPPPEISGELHGFTRRGAKPISLKRSQPSTCSRMPMAGGRQVSVVPHRPTC